MTEEILTFAPGYMVAAGYALSAVMFSTRNPARGTLWKRILIWISLVAFNVLLALATDLDIKEIMLPVQLATLGIAYGVLRLTCRISRKNAAYFTLCSLLIGELMASLSYQLYLQMFVVLEVTRPTLWHLIGCFVLFSGLLFWLLFLYERKYFSYNTHHQVSRQELLTALFIVFLFYQLSNIGYAVVGYRWGEPFSKQGLLQINVIRMLMDFAGVLLLESVRTIQAQNYKLSGVEKMQQLMEQQQTNFRVSEQSIALVNQKYHDMKHQIALLRAQTNDPVRLEQFDRMEDEMRSFEAEIDTGNYVLDIILASKMLECQKKHIQMTCSADGKLLNFMDQMDLCAMMGNLMDNAIEGVEKLADPEKRWIRVSLRKKNNFVILEVGNWFVGDVVFQEGLPVTTKQDKRFHGYGVQSIYEIVKRYSGTISITTENEWFEAKMVFVEPA